MLLKNEKEIDEILKKYRNKKTGIVTHVTPDGDGLASAIALYFSLKIIYNAIPLIIMDTEYPSFLDFLNYKNCEITSYESFCKSYKDNAKLDLLIVIDCHEEERADTNIKMFDISKNVLVIDHHEPKTEYFKEHYNYFIDSDAACTGIILHRFLKNTFKREKKLSKTAKELFLKDYAECIYTSIINDTGNFVNSNTDLEVFKTTLDLMEMGLEPSKITNLFLYRKSIDYYKFIGETLSTIELNQYKNIAYYKSTLKMLKDNNQTLDSYSKMMRWTTGAYDVDIQILFQEYENNLWIISFRSLKYDVSKIATHFGCGGHKSASGCKLKGIFNDIKNNVISYIESQIK